MKASAGVILVPYKPRVVDFGNDTVIFSLAARLELYLNKGQTGHPPLIARRFNALRNTRQFALRI